MNPYELAKRDSASGETSLALPPGSALEYRESSLAAGLSSIGLALLGWLAFDASIRAGGWKGPMWMLVGVTLLMGAAYAVYLASNPKRYRLVATPERLSWGRVGFGSQTSLERQRIGGVILDPHEPRGACLLALDGSRHWIEWDYFRRQERPDHFFLRNGIELIESPVGGPGVGTG